MTRLDEIPGINQRTAEVLIAELGVDMSVFPTDRHLSSWAGLCPGQNESAGKHKAGTSGGTMFERRLTLLISADWVPPDFYASRSCLTLGTDIAAKAAAFNVVEDSPPEHRAAAGPAQAAVD